jgi:hypothetical protein
MELVFTSAAAKLIRNDLIENAFAKKIEEGQEDSKYVRAICKVHGLILLHLQGLWAHHITQSLNFVEVW